MNHRAFVCLSLLLLGTPGAWSAETPPSPAAPRIDLQQDDAKGQLRATIDGQEAFVFNYGPTVDLPHFYPLRSPTGQSMLVQHPDPYPHHRALWFADTVERPDCAPAISTRRITQVPAGACSQDLRFATTCGTYSS